MSLLQKPRNQILIVYKSLKIKVCFETLLAKKTFRRGFIIDFPIQVAEENNK